MKEYLFITTCADNRTAYQGYYSKRELETTDMKEFIPQRKGSCKYRKNYDGSMDIIIKV